jgi:ABC-type polysaccharide/polyol phosphate transport system ATPase subunit
MNEIIKLNSVSKNFIINNDTSIRKSVSNLAKDIFKIPYDKKDNFLALNKISFDLEKGTTLGLIGSNGSGKSTLLKLITRVTYPTSGDIYINGRVASLLEIGAGFHIEFTGRENIYLNGAIMGLTKKEIDSKIDEIIDFSELRKFIDTPIKKYSSGMYVKLGFSVAIHTNPDILLVDEVLSVGDSNFQNKCIKKMREIVSDSSKTVILVSHNMVTIQALCDKTLWLEKGNLRSFGETSKVIAMYSEEINKRSHNDNTFNDRDNKSLIYSEEVNTYSLNNNKKNSFYNESMKIDLTYVINQVLEEELICVFVIEAIDLGMTIMSISTKNKMILNNSIGKHNLSCIIDLSSFSSREYSIRVLLSSSDMLINYDTWYDSTRFYVESPIDISNLDTNSIIVSNYEFIQKN